MAELMARSDQLPLFEFGEEAWLPTPPWAEAIWETLRQSVEAESPALTPEQVYAQQVPYGYRKRLGQFFTPPEVARFMVRWATAQAPQTFLDPAVGTGIFLETLASAGLAEQPSVTAFDIDPVLAMLARERYRVALQRSGRASPEASLDQVVQRDFLTAQIAARFDAIVCNPPYIRHHDLPYRPTLFRQFDTLAGRRLSRNTNAYGLFLVKIQALLSPTGRAAVITPSEFLNADFGVGLKACLLATHALHAFIVFHHGLVLFDDLLTTACITLLSRQRAPEEPIHLVEVADLAALERLPALLDSPPPGTSLPEAWGSVSRIPPREFQAAAKWRSLKVPRPRPQAGQWVPFSDLARIMRGIATGANAFFTLSQAEVDEWGIEERFLRPCLSKASQARGLDFVREDWETLRRAQKKVWLLHCNEAPSFAVAAYLRAGEQQGLHRRYLTRHRTPWYAPEHREVAPLWVTVFGRTGLRFVRNRAGVWNLTAYHGIYPKFDDPTLLSALMAYLTSPLAAEKLSWELRTYGDGLLKVEPRDVLRLPVLNVLALPGAEVAELANLFDELCRQQRFEPPEAMAETRARIGEILQRYAG